MQQARRKFFGDSPAGIERNGYLEDLDRVTPQALAEAYAQMVRTARVEVLALGADADEVEARLLQKLDAQRRAPALILPAMAMPAGAARSYTEQVDAVQGKLCLLFTAGRPLTGEELTHMRLAAALFGGLPSSRLFRNVRERQSLCYYCSCGFSYLTSALSVDSGVQPENAAKAQKAILRELEALAAGPITEQELRETKLSYLGALRAVGDSLASIETWAFREILRGTFQDPQEVERAVERTIADEIRSALSLFTLSVSYLLTKGGAADGR